MFCFEIQHVLRPSPWQPSLVAAQTWAPGLEIYSTAREIFPLSPPRNFRRPFAPPGWEYVAASIDTTAWRFVEDMSRSSKGGPRGIKRKSSALNDDRPSTSSGHSLARKTTSSRNGLKRAGPYLLGPRLGNSPVRSIVQCLAKKEGTDDFYSVKILTLADPGQETQDDKQGKMLLHTEYSLLSLLHDQDGVVHHHGLFKDECIEENPSDVRRNSEHRRVGVVRHRLCLVLDCLCAHDFSNDTVDLINLQHYVIREKRLLEKEAIIIFHDIVRVVERLHEVMFVSLNLIHRVGCFVSNYLFVMGTCPSLHAVPIRISSH